MASFRGGAPKSADHGVADHVMTRVGRYQRKKLHLNRSTTSVTKSDSACRIAGEQSFGLAQVQYACTATVSGTFNSLSKVLCTFPSWYLFSIGFEDILRFRWNIPPALRSHPKEHDSESMDRTPRTRGHERDSHPL